MSNEDSRRTIWKRELREGSVTVVETDPTDPRCYIAYGLRAAAQAQPSQLAVSTAAELPALLSEIATEMAEAKTWGLCLGSGGAAQVALAVGIQMQDHIIVGKKDGGGGGVIGDPSPRGNVLRAPMAGQFGQVILSSQAGNEIYEMAFVVEPADSYSATLVRIPGMYSQTGCNFLVNAPNVCQSTYPPPAAPKSTPPLAIWQGATATTPQTSSNWILPSGGIALATVAVYGVAAGTATLLFQVFGSYTPGGTQVSLAATTFTVAVVAT